MTVGRPGQAADGMGLPGASRRTVPSLKPSGLATVGSAMSPMSDSATTPGRRAVMASSALRQVLR